MRVQFQEEKMHTKDAIKFALTVSNGAVLSVIDEMSAAATTFPTPNGGGHPPWGLGRIPLVGGMVSAANFLEKDAAAGRADGFLGEPDSVSRAQVKPPRGWALGEI